MQNNNLLNKFNDIYNNTYKNLLGYIILHCNNLEDINDLIQETYIELYKTLMRFNSKSNINDINKYIIGISKNILKKYYRNKYKSKKVISIQEHLENNKEIFLNLDNSLELNFITKENIEDIWIYLEKKDIKIPKIFYCYYFLDMKIKDIAIEMNINESTIKNYLYRTIKELKEKFCKESDEYV